MALCFRARCCSCLFGIGRVGFVKSLIMAGLGRGRPGWLAYLAQLLRKPSYVYDDSGILNIISDQRNGGFFLFDPALAWKTEEGIRSSRYRL